MALVEPGKVCILLKSIILTMGAGCVRIFVPDRPAAKLRLPGQCLTLLFIGEVGGPSADWSTCRSVWTLPLFVAYLLILKNAGISGQVQIY